MKHNDVELSIIVPIFNSEQYLPRCIESFIQQIDDSVEVVLVDDGSTDNSGKICDGYNGKYNNIKVIHKENEGTAVARNIGIENSCGGWLCFVDADDVVDKNFFKIVSTYYDSSEDLILFDHEIMDDNKKSGRVNNATCTIIHDGDILIKKCFLGQSLKNGHCMSLRSVWGKLYRKSFVLDNGLIFDEGVKQAQDMLFMLKIYERISAAKYVPTPVYGYYFHNETSITNRFKPDYEKIVDSYIRAITPWLDRRPEYKIYHMYFRLNDIILYLKYNLFHPKNKLSDVEKRKIVKRLFAGDPYKAYYKEVKDAKLLKKYGIDKRIVFFLATHNVYLALKLIAKVKYGQ